MRLTERDSEFKQFFITQKPRLERVALLMTGDADLAADLAQEALLKTYRSWRRIRRDDPGPYARQILVNLCRNHHRRRALELRKPATPPESSTDPDLTEALRVAAALATLPPLRRAVMVLRYYEDMTEMEVARVLDRPLNTVKSDIRRSLERLRPLLAEGAKTP